MKFEAITIKDIAVALGLSTSTVSRALRDSYEISPETKKRVLEYARENNYHPNPIALGLKERRTQSVGIMVAEIANSFFSQVINGAESVAHKKQYNVIISQNRESGLQEINNLNYLTSRSIDGLLISVSSATVDPGVFTNLIQRGMPIVFFDRVIKEIDTHKVVVDNLQGAYDACKHLIKNGYKRIAAIAGSETLSITHDRLAGYNMALSDHRLPVNENMIEYCPAGGLHYNETEKAVKKLLALKPRPDAILALADKLTIGCLKVLKAKKIDVPGQMGLIGFSNSELTSFFEPSLSIIKQPAFEIGEIAMKMLLQLIESKKPVTEFETKLLKTSLILGNSSSKRI